jgi:hypothetical protein
MSCPTCFIFKTLAPLHKHKTRPNKIKDVREMKFLDYEVAPKANEKVLLYFISI